MFILRVLLYLVSVKKIYVYNIKRAPLPVNNGV